jgi:catechol 2,3-dioxygenase-like lactoylglutathione lyase family enzyme
MPMNDERGEPERTSRRQQPETLRLRAVMPVLSVADLERSLAWYRDILGFVVAEEGRKDGRLTAVQLKAGKVRFLLRQDPEARGRRHQLQGVHLLCATRQDVDKLAASIQVRGGRVEEAPGEAHAGRDFTVLDPDGVRISIFWRPEA